MALWGHSVNHLGKRHPLEEHLEGTGQRAEQNARPFGVGSLARHLGLLHDVGKGACTWQDGLLRAERTGGRVGIPHKHAGTWLAEQQGLNVFSGVVFGHHGGLPSRSRLRSEVGLAEGSHRPQVEEAIDRVSKVVPQILTGPGLPNWIEHSQDPMALDALIRMVFSAVVDADYLDTAAHFDGGPRTPHPVNAVELVDRFEAARRKKFAETPDSPVNTLRRQIYEQAVAGAAGPVGLYRLPSPTGSGKTLSAAGFALHHAAAHGLRRVIVAVPFMSITEQNAGVYRSLLDQEENTPVVLEHHSGIDLEESDGAVSPAEWWRRLAAENWDSPFVVTTTVQLFESLFSNRPAAMRRLHNITGSVLVLDEPQALPDRLLLPILSMLRTLTENFGVTVLLASATQPAYGNLQVVRDLPIHDLLSGEAHADAIQGGLDDASAGSFPASDPIAISRRIPRDEPPRQYDDGTAFDWPSDPAEVVLDGDTSSIDHGDVVIAAITSCTNTSNPSVMIGAALLAKKAVERGLRSKPWVKTTLAPGSRVVTDYYNRSGLTPYLEQLGFDLVGYGCTTCIGNSGPLIPAVSTAVADHDLTVASVLSGNRNFEGRIHSEVKMNFLASPPLVIAYALAGTMHADLLKDPLGQDSDGNPVYLRDIWPPTAEIKAIVDENLEAKMFTEGYSDVYAGDDNWRGMHIPEGDRFAWDDTSTYVQRPPYFDDISAEPTPIRDITGARVLALLGDSVTTDHISPAGAIRQDSPAGQYLIEQGVEPADFNSYGSRRGNHNVMIRGTFANVRLRNQLVPGVEGGFTQHWPDGGQQSIFDAATSYSADGVPLIIIAGSDYGSGSSRDWAAKGTSLLGVKAVLASSFERIHRSNLIGMGVLPLQFPAGDTAESLGLTGDEVYSVIGLEDRDRLPSEVTVRIETDGRTREIIATLRIDTPAEEAYYLHGGILPYVLRHLLEP